MKTCVLVTGATGYVGGRLVPRLLERGHRVRCLVRHPERLDAARWKGSVEVVRGDVLRPETLGPSLRGASAAYYLVHSMAAGARGFEERDVLAARNFGQAAREAGVGQVVYLGGLGDDVDTLSSHLKSRHETGEVLRSTGVPVTELRAAVVVGSGSISFEMVRYLTERLPIMIAPRWAKTRCQPIAIGDLLSYLVGCLEHSDVRGRVLEIGGADVLTYNEMMLGYARVRGLRRRIVTVPVLTPYLSSLWVDLVTPIPAAFARPLIQGLRSEVIVRNPAARSLFPEIRPVGYEEAVRRALERVASRTIETVWSGSSASAFDRAPENPRVDAIEGLVVERRERVVRASAESVFRVVSRLGGATGWLYADALWDLRGWIDRLLGGVGMRRGRRDPERVRPGDAVDFWRVEAVESDRRLLLGAEMKLPGRAWLELRVEPDPGPSAERNRDAVADGARCRLRTTAMFEPKGLAGIAYWYGLYPFHALIFSGMVRRIAERAERESD